MSEQSNVFIGIKGTVVALDASTGQEIWRTDLPGAYFVNVASVGAGLYASTKGEMFSLDPATGSVLWHNKLKGLGVGFVTIAGGRQVPTAAALLKQRQSDAGAAAAAAASS